jgi:hypothetical protein
LLSFKLTFSLLERYGKAQDPTVSFNLAYNHYSVVQPDQV